MFSHITRNWRGKPRVSHEVTIQLIAHTATAAGLKVRASPDRRRYPTGEKVSNAEFARIKLTEADLHGDWNYAIQPR